MNAIAKQDYVAVLFQIPPDRGARKPEVTDRGGREIFAARRTLGRRRVPTERAGPSFDSLVTGEKLAHDLSPQETVFSQIAVSETDEKLMDIMQGGKKIGRASCRETGRMASGAVV